MRINGQLLTFQKSLVLRELLSIAQFLEILRFLSKILSLNESITLICNDLRGSRVQLGNRIGQVNTCMQSAR